MDLRVSIARNSSPSVRGLSTLCHALILLCLGISIHDVSAQKPSDTVKIQVSRNNFQPYQDDLPLADPLIKSFCKNCNLVLSEPELMTFVENFYKSVNQVTSARNRLAYQMECDGCNVILASSGDIPRVVEILAAGKKQQQQQQYRA